MTMLEEIYEAHLADARMSAKRGNFHDAIESLRLALYSAPNVPTDAREIVLGAIAVLEKAAREPHERDEGDDG